MVYCHLHDSCTLDSTICVCTCVPWLSAPSFAFSLKTHWVTAGAGTSLLFLVRKGLSFISTIESNYFKDVDVAFDLRYELGLFGAMNLSVAPKVVRVSKCLLSCGLVLHIS